MDGAKKLDHRSIACINMHILLTVVGTSGGAIHKSGGAKAPPKSKKVIL